MSKAAKWSVAGVLLGVLIFLLSPSFNNLISNFAFWNAKEQFLYLTGSIAIVYMVMCMLLSVRFSFINNLTGGLDKAYVIHKWAGIWAFVFSVIHWFIESWFIDICKALFELPPKVKGASTISEFAKSIYGIGNDLVEYAFYIIVVVLIVALIKKMPYHIFRYIHKIIPVLFLVIAYHSFTIQIKGAWFGSAGSYILSAVIFVGVIAAVIDLFQLIGCRHKVFAEVVKSEHNEKNRTLELILKPAEHFEYRAGQYVFLKFCHSKEPHPFSIAGYDKENNTLRFLIKELGDFTRELPKNIKKDDIITIEGPYGSFTFNDTKAQQIWTAGGIGVTPFAARLEYLVSLGQKVDNVDFFYSARGENPYPELADLSEKAGVRFHYRNTSKESRLNFNMIKEKIKDIKDTSLWYCGPAAFGETLQKSAAACGISKKDIHYDSFDMR